jgi:hypothetical protein
VLGFVAGAAVGLVCLEEEEEESNRLRAAFGLC